MNETRPKRFDVCGETTESDRRSPVCERALPAGRGGRPRRYCSIECRRDAEAIRRRGWTPIGDATAVRLDAETLPELPADRLTVRDRAIAAVAAELENAPAAPVEDRLGAALVDARTLAFLLQHRIAPKLAPPLADRAAALGAWIDGSLAEQFPELD